MRRLGYLLTAALLLLAPAQACAQSSPGLITGQVPTAAQWNSYFVAKQDTLGFTPLNRAGGSMTGPLVTTASSTSVSGLRLPPGAAPSSPVAGDLWTTNAGLYVRIGSTTVGPLGTGGGSGGTPGGTSGQVQYNDAGSFGGFTMAGDCTLSQPNITCTKTNGSSFGALATSTDAANLTGTVAAARLTGASYSFTTPVLGAATATSINKVAITAPATSATLSIANGKTLTVSNTIQLAGTVDGGVIQFRTGGTVAYVGNLGITGPGGRLTLVSGVPVLTSDQTAKSTIYYTQYKSSFLPSYNGGDDTLMVNFGGEVSFILDATNHTSGNLYDIFWSNDDAVLVTGPAWTNTTTRSAALGYTPAGFLSNAGSMTGRLSNNGGTTTIGANAGLYLGTFRATANGQTGMAFQPAAAAGGTANVLGLYNYYNRIKITAYSRDNTSMWTYSSTTWRAANNSASNAISYVDGAGDVTVDATYFVSGDLNGSGLNSGINRDSTSATPVLQSAVQGGLIANGAPVSGAFLPSLGYHTLTAMESNYDTGNVTRYGSGFGGTTTQTQYLSVFVEM